MNPSRSLRIKIKNHVFTIRRIAGLEAVWGVILLAGFSLRMRQYAFNRSIWLDEAFLTEKMGFGFLSHLRPVGFVQGAPLGWLWMEEAMVLLFGKTDWVVRIVPLFFGCMGFWIVCRWLKRQDSPWVAIPACMLVGLSWSGVYFSSEVKPYSADLFFSSLFFFLNADFFRKPSPAGLQRYVLTGLACIFMSIPGVFYLAGSGIYVFAVSIQGPDKILAKKLLGVFVVWVAFFCLIYFAVYRFIDESGAAKNFWTGYFAPLKATEAPSWIWKSLLEALHDPVGLKGKLAAWRWHHDSEANPFALAEITGIFLIFGFVATLRAKHPVSVISLLALAVMYLASGFKKYPIHGRMLVFMAPIFSWWVFAGVRAVTRPIRAIGSFRQEIVLFSLLSAWLLAHPFNTAMRNAKMPANHENIKAMMWMLENRHAPGDTLYVYNEAFPAFCFYEKKYDLSQIHLIHGSYGIDDPENIYPGDVSGFLGAKRVWLLFSHNCWWCDINPEKYILSLADLAGDKIEEYKSMDCSLYLYDLSSARLE